MAAIMTKCSTGKLIRLYEGNYKKIMYLAPGLEQGRNAAWTIRLGATHLHVSILERHKYTSTLLLTHRLGIHDHYVKDPTMKVRVYHDAKVAEVLSYQNQSKFRVVYPYPNPQMRQRFEKRYINQFLSEWLNHCIARIDKLVSEAPYTNA